MTPEYNQMIANIVAGGGQQPQQQPQAAPGPGPGDPAPTSPLPITKKQHWNDFVDFLDKTGYKGNTVLDDRSTNLGQQLLTKFNQANPNSQLSYNDVSQIQSELQAYRQGLVNKWKAGSATAGDIKSEDQIMPGLSKVDGWLGSKTSSYKFPAASIVNTTTGEKQNFGLNTDLYDKVMAQKQGAAHKP